jgi:hypothetical protein
MSLSLFLDSIKSEETRRHYSLYLQKYFEFACSDFDSSYLNAGESYLHKFNKKGTYDYYCTLYPFMYCRINKMVYLDSLDSFYSINHEPRLGQ